MADEMRPEYDFSQGERGKYAGRVERNRCPNCGNVNMDEMEVVNTSMSRDPLFSDLVCLKCGEVVRPWNSV